MRRIAESSRRSRHGTFAELTLVVALLITALLLANQGLGAVLVGSVSNMVADLEAS